MEANKDKRLNSHFTAEGDFNEEEADFMQYKLVQSPVGCSIHLKRKHNRWLPRMPNISPVVGSKMLNAIIAVGMVISIGSVRLHHDPPKEVADRIVVVGTPENGEEVTEEDHNSQLEPL